MRKQVAEIHESIGRALSTLPDVFSSVQWGGRAYKLPGPGGSTKKPKLLAHVCLSKAGDFVDVSFRLEKQRAVQVIKTFNWMGPHPFRTLAPSGWVTAEVRTKTQCKALAKLLRESRLLHPIETSPTRPARDVEIEVVTRRIAAVVREKRAAGWKPPAREELD
jgi:hypothetical protein